MSWNLSHARSFSFSLVMLVLILGCGLQPCRAGQTLAPKPGEPADPKAQRSFAEAAEWQKRGSIPLAIDAYRKANTQDGGTCAQCLKLAHSLALEIGDYKTAESVLRDWLTVVKSDNARSVLHFQIGLALQREGVTTKGDKQRDCFTKSLDELRTALTLNPANFAAYFSMGIDFAYLHQDDASREAFRTFLEKGDGDEAANARAARFVDRVELARARMVPAFAVTTLDGQRITMDELAGKVVLIDFWATWCGPCREALPHIRKIAQEYKGQPFVVLSVSLDNDAAKWKEFVTKNEMTWLQYRDGGFGGPVAKMFSVDAIPATFSIDADGVLEDQHVGDANIEGRLKKMVAHAVEMQTAKPAQSATAPGPGNGS